MNQPPNVDGVCSFISDMTTCDAVQKSLASIRASFVADDNNLVISTFWITAKYNSTVAGTAIDTTHTYPYINGDTCEHCLALADGTTGAM